jgi:hypothetical protein
VYVATFVCEALPVGVADGQKATSGQLNAGWSHIIAREHTFVTPGGTEFVKTLLPGALTFAGYEGR